MIDGETEARGDAVTCQSSNNLDVGDPLFTQIPGCMCLATVSCVLTASSFGGQCLGSVSSGIFVSVPKFRWNVYKYLTTGEEVGQELKVFH